MMSTSASQAYELMVKSLLEAHLQAQGLADFKAYHLKKYMGKSGQEHEIDVSFEVSIGTINLLLIVECKHHNRPVGVDDIMTLSYRMRDISAHKGLLVTTHGFQAGTHQVAKAERIGLLIAVEGRIGGMWGYYTGAMDHHQFGIDQFTLVISPQGDDIRLLGRRHVTVNAEICASRFQEGDKESRRGVTMFLLPEEEYLVSQGRDPGRSFSPRAKGLGWGAYLPSGQAANEVEIV